MKRIIVVLALLAILVPLPVLAWEWHTVQGSFDTQNDDQEVLAVGSAHYCIVQQVEIVNYGSSDSVVKLHWEGTASASNRIIPEFTADADGGGRVYDDLWVIGAKGSDIDIDVGTSTDAIKVWIKYRLSTMKPSPK